MHGDIEAAGVEPGGRDAHHVRIQRALIYLGNMMQEFEDLVTEVRMGVGSEPKCTARVGKEAPSMSLGDLLANCPNHVNDAAARLSELTQVLRAALF